MSGGGLAMKLCSDLVAALLVLLGLLSMMLSGRLVVSLREFAGPLAMSHGGSGDIGTLSWPLVLTRNVTLDMLTTTPTRPACELPVRITALRVDRQDSRTVDIQHDAHAVLAQFRTVRIHWPSTKHWSSAILPKASETPVPVAAPLIVAVPAAKT